MIKEPFVGRAMDLEELKESVISPPVIPEWKTNNDCPF